MKKAFIAFGLLLACLVGFLLIKEDRLFSIGLNGFLYSDDEIKGSLINGKNEASYKAVVVSDIDDVIKKRGGYFVDDGERREKVTIDLPLVSDDGARLLVLNQGEAITEDFSIYTTFRGAVIADGGMYNLFDGGQVDKEKYLFLKTGEGLFVNTYEIMVDTLMGEKKVPKNSLILFETNEIKFYSLDSRKNEYRFGSIEGVDLINEIKMANKTLSYKDLISGLGVWEEEELVVEDEDIEEVVIEEDNESEEDVEDSSDGSGFVLPDMSDKLQVSAEFLDSSVYAARFKVRIHDPKNEIKKYPTVEIYSGERVVLRKTFYASAESEISGLNPDTEYHFEITYVYENEKKALIQGTLSSGDFRTKGLDEVEPVSFLHGDVEVRVNDATIKDLSLGNNASDNVLRGIDKIILVLNGREIKMSAGIVSTLRLLRAIDYKIPGVLNSNTLYHMGFKVIDVAGNELRVENAEIDFKTPKKAPSIKITKKEEGYTWFSLELSEENPDGVSITNLRYVILDGARVVEESYIGNDMRVKKEDLDENRIYKVLIYADYDLDDGVGNRRDQLMLNVDMVTEPIEKLGKLYVSLMKKDISRNSAKFGVTINSRSTKSNLITLLSNITFRLKDDNENIITTIDFSDEEMSSFKQLEEMILDFPDLNSEKRYHISADGVLKQGNMEYPVDIILDVDTFSTFKKPAEVSMINKFSNSSKMEFDVKVNDEDGGILSEHVLLKVMVEDVNDPERLTLVGIETLGINEDYKRFSFDKLEKGKKYHIKFIAEKYNVGFTNDTLEIDKELLDRDEVFEMKDGVEGDIVLESLLRSVGGKNYFDGNDSRRWKSRTDDKSIINNREYSDGVVYLSVRNGARNYAYYVPELVGKKVTVSFWVKLSDNSESSLILDDNNTNASLVPKIMDGDSSSGEICKINNLNDSEYQKYTCTRNNFSSGYIGFYLTEQSSANRTTTLMIKDLQIEEGANAADYETYRDAKEDSYSAITKINMTDNRDEIFNKKYYVKYYRSGEYEENNTHVHTIGGEVNPKDEAMLARNSEYVIKLTAFVNGVEREIASTKITTEQEIRSINNKTDLLRVHMNGKYIVTEDLDLTSFSNTINDFYGTIDFQGHKVIMGVTSGNNYLFKYNYGVLKNIDLHLTLDGQTTQVIYRYGLVNENRGTIENIMATLEGGSNIPFYNRWTTIITATNYGTVNNFVVRLKTTFYGSNYISTVCLWNYGTIKNGYLYGDEGTSITIEQDSSTGTTKYTGAIVGYQYSTGRIENVFSLIDVNMADDVVDGIAGNLAGWAENGSTLSHAFSNAKSINRTTNRDINFGGSSGSTSVGVLKTEELYYVSDKAYGSGSGSVRISPNMLGSIEFEDSVINPEGSFDIDNLVRFGYYPQLILPDVMPKQEYIPIEFEEDSVDVVTATDVQQENDDVAIITLKLKNQYAYDITGIDIENLELKNFVSYDGDKDQLNRSDGTTEIKIAVKPNYYGSSYKVNNVSYKTLGENIETKTYDSSNIKKVNIELYKSINDEDDWDNVKRTANGVYQNYILRRDLDFSDKPADKAILSRGAFYGKLDGNGHKISDIKLVESDGVVGDLYGTIKNLYVENFEHYPGFYVNTGGFISRSFGGSRIENVHLSNVTLAGSRFNGGIVARMHGTVVRDSSVTNIEVDADEIGRIYRNSGVTVLVGGITGRMANNSIIENSFVQEVNFDLKNLISTRGVGGIVGEVVSGGGSISNVYSTGKIKVKTAANNGGIVGIASGSGSLSNAYSNVDIHSINDVNIGGIVGSAQNEATYAVSYVVSNTLSVGSIYTSLKDGIVRRILGNDVNINQFNYAWADQRINGNTSSNTSGEVLVKTEDLKNPNTYINGIVNLGQSFMYGGVSDGSLPLLLPSNERILEEFLQIQIKNYLKIYDFEVRVIEIVGTENQKEIQFVIDGLENVEPTGVIIDGVNDNEVIKIRKTGTIYRSDEIIPEHYYDSYELIGIEYKDSDGEVLTVPYELRIDMQLYGTIKNQNDWNDVKNHPFENFRLSPEFDDYAIDFSGYNAEYNLYFNRLDGIKRADKKPTIKNIEIIDNSDGDVGLINVVNNSLKNIIFDSIVINNQNKIDGGKTNKAGLIVYEYGNTENMEFKNISVQTKDSVYVGIVAYNSALSVRNILVDGVDVNGKAGVGGYSGGTDVNTAVNNVEVKNVSASGNGGNCVGGFVGYQLYNKNIIQFNISVENGVIRGSNNSVGGVYGYGAGSNLSAKNVEVFGAGYVGGIFGDDEYSHNQQQSGFIVENSTIAAKGSFAGGIAGYTNNETLFDVEVKGTNGNRTTVSGSSYVGGVSGRSYAVRAKVYKTDVSGGTVVGGVIGRYTGVSNIVVQDVTVTATDNSAMVGGVIGADAGVQNGIINKVTVSGGTNGNSVGGVVGYFGNGGDYYIRDVELTDVEVRGNNNVGGMVGMFKNTTVGVNILDCVANVNVQANGEYVGGIMGYAQPEIRKTKKDGSYDYFGKNNMQGNIVESSTIRGSNNVGGLLGGSGESTDEWPDNEIKSQINNNLIVIKLGENNTNIRPIIGNGEFGDNKYRYRKNMINNMIYVDGYDKNVYDAIGSESAYISNIDDLNTLKNSGPFGTNKFIETDEAHYPLKYFNSNSDVMKVNNNKITEDVRRVKLPEADDNAQTLALNNLTTGSRLLRATHYHVLPDYKIYPSDVNVINVEFSNTDEQTKFTINGAEYTVDSRVYSFSYDYDTEINFSMTDGINIKEATFTPDEIRSHFATIENKYYILRDDGEIVSNDDAVNGKRGVNIFNGKILTKDGEIILLKDGSIEVGSGVAFEKLVDVVPLYHFERNSTQIDSFANFSVIDGVALVEKQILYKGIQTELMASDLKNIKWQGVMDSYNNKDYMTILGEDGVIYDLKNALMYPDNFDNTKIKEISNNIQSRTDLMIVKYENGRVLVFNYRNGSVVYQIKADVIPTPLEYFVQEITNENNSLYDNEEISNNLAGAEKLMSEIKNGSVVSGETSIPAAGDYVVAFDPIKNEYEIYDMGSLLRVDPLGATYISVSDQIYGDNSLNLLFGDFLSNNKMRNPFVLVIYSGIVVLMAASMIGLGGLLRKKKA